MSSCMHVQPLLVLYAEGALESDEKQLVEAHLSGCPQCNDEAAGIARIRGWLADPELFVPQQDMAWQLLPEKLAARVRAPQVEQKRRFPLRFPKWAFSAAAVVALACGLVWMMRYHTTAPQLAGPAPIRAGNEAFLERMRTVYAREATAQYLNACQELLLDVMNADTTCGGERVDVALEVSRARELLRQKQRLETDLQVPEAARVRDLCGQLEHLLINLSMSSECESGDTLRDMERYIKKEQLLLRINLLQSGIS